MKGGDMKSQRYGIEYFFVLGCILAVMACAGGPETTASAPQQTGELAGVQKLENPDMQTIQQQTPITTTYENLIITPVNASDQIKTDYPDALSQFQSAVLSRVREKGGYQNVTGSGASPSRKSLAVALKVLDMRIASGAARFWGGALAGQSFMEVYAKFTDTSSGRVLHKKVISSTASAFGAAWSFGASDRSLPSDVGTMIGEYIVTVVPGSK